MDIGFTAEQDAFRAEVRAALRGPAVAAALAAYRSAAEREPDPHPLYAVLGGLDLLAVHWPAAYGGQDRTLTDAAIVAEELVRAGIPDTAHVNTVQIVGQFVLMAGTDDQRRRFLPALAAGRELASVLYTEPEAGSDLGALAAVAEPDGSGDGYRLHGAKVFSLKTRFARLGLCAARTGTDTASRYEGISLFLVDLTAAGVRVATIPSIAAEQFHRVELDGVRVPAADRLGAEGAGWALLSGALAVERTGLDYVLKAEHWLDAALATFGTEPPDAADLEAIGRFGGAVAAGRVLAWQVLGAVLAGRPDEAGAAAAKYHTSELAAAVARWGAQLPGAGATLAEAYLEAPGLTLSAGTSEVMLEVVAAALDTFGPDGS